MDILHIWRPVASLVIPWDTKIGTKQNVGAFNHYFNSTVNSRTSFLTEKLVLVPVWILAWWFWSSRLPCDNDLIHTQYCPCRFCS